MKRIPSLLIALALGSTTLSAQAGLITDPLSVLSPVIGQGLITDPLSVSAPQLHISAPSAASVNMAAASTFLADVLSSLPADGTLRLSDLFMNPEFFAAAHAAGPAADALRGQIDWLMLTGVILGFDGMDGSDDLRGSDNPDEIFGESGNGIILGGPGTDTLAPFNPSIILGGPGTDTVILGGPGTDTLAPFSPSIILGGPGTDTVQPHANLRPFNPSIILGGPGTDTFSSVSAGHRPN